MKGSRQAYPSVTQLPSNAKCIANYARECGISVAYVYKLYKQGKIRIVTFETYNFVI